MKARPEQYWAHMLDESFNEGQVPEAVMPKDENTKFKFGEVFTDDIETNEGIEKVFDEIWPGWLDYFTNEVEKKDCLELQGRQRDVDDWDVWKVRVEDMYNGIDGMADAMFEDLYERWDAGKTTTLKEVVDTEIERLVDSIADGYDIGTLEANGQLIWKGHKHYGGPYPEH